MQPIKLVVSPADGYEVRERREERCARDILRDPSIALRVRGRAKRIILTEEPVHEKREGQALDRLTSCIFENLAVDDALDGEMRCTRDQIECGVKEAETHGNCAPNQHAMEV